MHPTPPPPLPETLEFQSLQSAAGADPGREQRVHARARVRLAVTVASGSNFYVGQTENLSEGGVFVATLFAQPVGARVELAVHLDDGRGPLRIEGEVRWVRAAEPGVTGGMGVRFRELPAEDLERIRAFTRLRGPLRL